MAARSKIGGDSRGFICIRNKKRVACEMTEEGTDSDLDDDAVNELDDWDMNEDTAVTLPAWILYTYLFIYICVSNGCEIYPSRSWASTDDNTATLSAYL